ncbi:serpin family protein [Streptomyces pactum]|uniref:Uncharacterized protein n=1 Tax=Streptomyces pactum TaxID=68249 RepID=A0A1S6J7J1_9ACTN|nr:serpin family protein [Streptomyces pactum]AQS67733.1 hypothetical protein B1H29_13090 [Streptomyces pactum]
MLGDPAVDVHLLLGAESMASGQVLGAGIGILARARPVTPGSRLPYGEAGPGLRVGREHTSGPEPPALEVSTTASGMTAGHDLPARPGLFGLTAAARDAHGHFPGVSSDSRYVEAARQLATATFDARGFGTAAVTAIGALGCALPRPRRLSTAVRAVFDRPFGFLAVHRHTRLALAAGRVTDPEPHREGEVLH